MLGIVFVSIFLITAEHTIVGNGRLIQSGDIDSTWTLGQIFPLVVVGVPVTSFAKISIRSCRAHRKKAKRFAEMSKTPVVDLHVKDWHDHLSLGRLSCKISVLNT
ncbi:hypothetical protein BDZ94DRAFT_1267745 [Collybia nuda]|uniref:Uncharacterized protein n=1 Tax=Collybia nuda TaxID=64659 RepID=A0A9P6CG73_9AGAR|nr:hypothetical protein BDZ94DRAFT_1267745 [Collybia nuda]